MMKLIIAGLALISLTSHAAEWWGRQNSQSSTRTRASVGSSPTSLWMTAAPAILAGDGVALPGLNVQVAGRVVRELPLNLTFDAGPFFYTSTGFQVIFPLLFGMDYEFQLPGNPKVRPVLGVNLGPVIGRRVVFAMLFRPGVNIYLARNIALNFEPRLGVFASSFVFMGQFGVRFAL